MKGRVITKVQGYYYVESDNEVYECRLRGVLKKKNKKDNCIVGDIVEFDEGAINEIYERENLIPRPLVANIDYLVITFAAKNPDFDMNRFNLLLLNSYFYKIKPFVVINKIELLTDEELNVLRNDLSFLSSLGIEVIYTSTYENNGIDLIKDKLKDKLTALGGPSGVGKSSIINKLQSHTELEVGETSKKIGRGKHTTKGTTLLKLDNGGYIIDTPGFSSVELPPIEDNEELIELFPEFHEYSCKFNDCIHINEPKCGIKLGVESGEVSEIRYEFYKKTYETLKIERWNNYD